MCRFEMSNFFLVSKSYSPPKARVPVPRITAVLPGHPMYDSGALSSVLCDTICLTRGISNPLNDARGCKMSPFNTETNHIFSKRILLLALLLFVIIPIYIITITIAAPHTTHT